MFCITNGEGWIYYMPTTQRLADKYSVGLGDEMNLFNEIEDALEAFH